MTRPIHIDYPQAVPATYHIDARPACTCKNDTCKICVPTCRSNAIDFSQKAKEVTSNVGAVILSPGFGRVSKESLWRSTATASTPTW